MAAGIHLGATNMTGVVYYVGTAQITEIYLGNQKIV
jgi:hypothetical protein|tara:strand:- start:762 stop:869 length:108 start_codon:yes stop_codon:yes gene_type:complete